MKKATNAIAIMDRMIGDDPELKNLISEERENEQTARLIREVWLSSGLTQSQLAMRVGTRQSMIARLEGADYSGHSLAMLMKIAYALEMRLEVQFVPLVPSKSAPPHADSHTKRNDPKTDLART